ncbi:hypothetical protein TNCT_597981 [Trichonephila clavata]|uniref:Uncharacterized protein n=1 Tax=Trichonephila clavata TaxID=2740835 RepID=A0A8X6KYQ5_TRICU|nr:hypothetical protein TNCT_597981 [Trichonephila clavata]
MQDRHGPNKSSLGEPDLRSRCPVPEKREQTRKNLQPCPRCSKGTINQEAYTERRSQGSKISWRIAAA